jgi:hypothetical protein
VCPEVSLPLGIRCRSRFETRAASGHHPPGRTVMRSPTIATRNGYQSVPCRPGMIERVGTDVRTAYRSGLTRRPIALECSHAGLGSPPERGSQNEAQRPGNRPRIKTRRREPLKESVQGSNLATFSYIPAGGAPIAALSQGPRLSCSHAIASVPLGGWMRHCSRRHGSATGRSPFPIRVRSPTASRIARSASVEAGYRATRSHVAKTRRCCSLDIVGRSRACYL